MRAKNLVQVLRHFDPKMPLAGQDLRMWFVSRRSSPRRRLEIALRNMDDAQKILFVGHRGSGKTTELNKLAEEIDDKFVTIGFNALDITGRATLRYEDLMLVLSTQVTRYCIQNELIGRPVAEPMREGWQALADWWRQVVAGLDIAPRVGEVSTYATLNTLLGEIEIGATQSAFTREQLNQQVDRQMPELIRRLNWVIQQAQAHLNPKRLLLIIEGLDKVDLEAARHVFRDHAPTITALNVAMIFTFPLALRYSDDYQTVRRNFHQDHFLHNITLRDHDGGDNLEGSKALEKMVAKRMETTLIAGDALQAVVAVSGGIPLELVKLVSSAAIYALERDERAGQIELADAQNAIKDLRRELAANLSLAEWTLLDQRHKDRKLSNEPAVQQLLYKGALIEYANDVQWCDVHPALWSVLDHYVEETA